MTTELKDHAQVVQTTCNGVCDKFDIEFSQITVFQRAWRKICMLSRKVIQNTTELSSTIAKVKAMYIKMN